MQQPPFPPGWDDANVQRVLSHYENQSEEDAVFEHEAALVPSSTYILGRAPLAPEHES